MRRIYANNIYRVDVPNNITEVRIRYDQVQNLARYGSSDYVDFSFNSQYKQQFITTQIQFRDVLFGRSRYFPGSNCFGTNAMTMVLVFVVLSYKCTFMFRIDTRSNTLLLHSCNRNCFETTSSFVSKSETASNLLSSSQNSESSMQSSLKDYLPIS